VDVPLHTVVTVIPLLSLFQPINMRLELIVAALTAAAVANPFPQFGKGNNGGVVMSTGGGKRGGNKQGMRRFSNTYYRVANELH
jgi:hypothetical protein